MRPINFYGERLYIDDICEQASWIADNPFALSEDAFSDNISENERKCREILVTQSMEQPSPIISQPSPIISKSDGSSARNKNNQGRRSTGATYLSTAFSIKESDDPDIGSDLIRQGEKFLSNINSTKRN